jgi:hypothetical protein
MKCTKLLLNIIPLLLLGSAMVYAAAPSGWYLPGATTNPDCTPGDVDCFVQIVSSSSWSWSINGNTGTNTGNFIGTIDNSPLIFKVNGFENMRIANNGFIWIGTDAPSDELHLSKITSGGYDIRSDSYGQNSTLTLNRASGTFSSPTIPWNGASIGKMQFWTWDGTQMTPISSIQTSIDAAPGAADTPSNLRFFTTLDGTNTQVERMRIDNAGRFMLWITASPVAFFHYVNQNTLNENAVFERYGNTSWIQFRTANGTFATPSAVTNNQRLMRLAATGYNGSNFSNNRWEITIAASENWTTGANGTRITFSTTPVWTNTLSQRMILDDQWKLWIGTITPTTTLTINGIISMGVENLTSASTISKSYVSLNPLVNLTQYTLPSPVDNPGAIIFIRNTHNTNSARLITTAGLLFDNTSTSWVSQYDMASTWSSKTVIAMSDGSNWNIGRFSN